MSSVAGEKLTGKIWQAGPLKIKEYFIGHLDKKKWQTDKLAYFKKTPHNFSSSTFRKKSDLPDWLW